MTASRHGKTNRVADVRMGVALVLAGVLGVSSGTRQEARAAMQGHGLVGVVGHWTSIDDEGPAFKGDGGRWSGQTSRAELGRVRGVLFPVLSESFVASATASGAFPLAVYRDATNFTQGTVRTRFKLIGGTDDRNAGIVVGLDTSGAYFFVRYNTKDGNVAVWRYAGGERQVLAHGEAHEQLAPGAWHELVVTVGGGKVKGEVSGRGLTVEYTLDRPLNGRVGLWTKRDAVTAFKDFRVSHQVNVPGRGT